MKLFWIIVGYICIFLCSVIFGAFVLNNFLTEESPLFPKNIEWNDDIGKVYKDLTYGEKPLNNFDLYVPAQKWKNSDKLIVYIHAGGFTGGDKSDDANIAKSFASKWYVVVTVNYSLRSLEDQEANVQMMSDEIKASIPRIKEEAAKLGYNLNSMAVAGGSAGGTLAMIFAYRDAETSPIPVKLIFQMVWPAGFEPSAWFGFNDFQNNEQATAAAGFVTVMSWKPTTIEMMRDGSYKENLKNISPYELVTENAPPTVVAYGRLDKVAPYAASEDYLIPALEKNNVIFENIVFENSGHALNRDTQQSQLLFQKIEEYLEKYLQ